MCIYIHMTKTDPLLIFVLLYWIWYSIRNQSYQLSIDYVFCVFWVSFCVAFPCWGREAELYRQFCDTYLPRLAEGDARLNLGQGETPLLLQRSIVWHMTIHISHQSQSLYLSLSCLFSCTWDDVNTCAGNSCMGSFPQNISWFWWVCNSWQHD